MMARTLLIGLFLTLPLSGCLGDATPAARQNILFSYETVERGDPEPQRVESCEVLLEELNQRALDQARVRLEQSVSNVRRYTRALDFGVAQSDQAASAPQPAAGAPGGRSGAPAAEAQVTGTNNQEADADEGDLVKTDGVWTYVLSGGILHILHSTKVGDIEEWSSMEFENSWGGQLLLARNDPKDARDDRLVVVLPGQSLPGDGSSRGGWHYGYSGGATRVVVLSLEDRAAPRVIDEALVEGTVMGARLVGDVAYVVVHVYEADLGLRSSVYPSDEALRSVGVNPGAYRAMPERLKAGVIEKIALEADRENRANLSDAALGDHLPDIYRGRGAGLSREPIDEAACKGFYSTPGTKGRGVTTILATDLAAEAVPSRTTQVSGGSPIVYASGEALVLAAPTQEAWWFWAQPELEEATDLQWFDLDGLEVRPRASGRVLGTVMDSFSMDVEGDELRVATTTGSWGRWWLDGPEPMMSHVAVFVEARGVLVQKGIVGGIAPGERIWSARFTEDRAYIVTFRQVDPLWVIDLSSPVPSILGELEIPGVSTYIHPLDEDTLLTIGYGPGPGGRNLDWSSVQVSLFDISDVARPKRADVLDLAPPDGWATSGATREHKAFTYWPAMGTLAVPLTTEGNRTYGGRGYHVALALVQVDLDERNLWVRGDVDQDRLVARNASWAPDIERSYFLGYPNTGPVSVYSVSALGVTAHDYYTLRAQSSVEFPEGPARPYYHGW